MEHNNAKRLKSSSGSPISVNRPSAGATALPQYQPPPARGSPSNQTPTASVSHTPPPGGKSSLKLTVKAAPSKLRQAISGSQLPPNPYADEASESDATPKPSARIARATRNPRTVVEQDSDEEDEDDDEDAEGEDDDEDADGEEVDQELLANEDSQEDAEGEDDDMEDSHPPPPVIKQQRVPGKAKPNVTVSAPSSGPLKSVEAKELEDADDDELSDLESGDEMELGEGEEEEEIADEDDDLSGSDDGSRSGTPDITKLTRRQRGVFEEENVGLLALSNEAQKKKMLSVEEHAMRRQEMARRRKNLSEKRNEEEKMETINKLLSKPAPKRRTRAEMIAAQQAADMTPGAEDEDGGSKANPLFARWVNNKSGSLVAVPDEWLESPLGAVFRSAQPAAGGGKMVEEVA